MQNIIGIAPLLTSLILACFTIVYIFKNRGSFDTCKQKKVVHPAIFNFFLLQLMIVSQNIARNNPKEDNIIFLCLFVLLICGTYTISIHQCIKTKNE